MPDDECARFDMPSSESGQPIWKTDAIVNICETTQQASMLPVRTMPLMTDLSHAANPPSNLNCGTGSVNGTAADSMSADLQPSTAATVACAAGDLNQLQGSQRNQPIDWLNYFQQCSRLLIAVVDPNTLELTYANDYFCHLAGLPQEGLGDRATQTLGEVLASLLSETDHQAILRLYGRHFLHLICRDLYGIDLRACRLLDEPVLLRLNSPCYAEPRYVEFWLRSEQLQVSRLDPQQDEFADLELMRNPEGLQRMLAHPGHLRQMEQRLNWKNYRVKGYLLLEGVDNTVPETIRRITQRLIDRDALISAEKFCQIDQPLRSLFRAQSTVVATLEADRLHLFRGAVSDASEATTYLLESQPGSPLATAMQTKRVVNVADLQTEAATESAQHLLALGVRSLLLIPLTPQIMVDGDRPGMGCSSSEPLNNQPTSQPRSPGIADQTEPMELDRPIGLVGLLSDRPYHFDGLDCYYAEQLIPAFTVALTSAQRHLVQQRFMANIHPSVEWRFLAEAERRSLGLPAEPIVFNDVYPLYGISDIRGSSDERNRAIQADLLEQFQLAMAILVAVEASQPNAFATQLRQDLAEHIERLKAGVTVDAEVSELRYLQEQVELYFDFFAGCSASAAAAIAAYRQACANEQGCVYRARAHYDQAINRINATLRQTWETWQVRMQQISRHYCDTEMTDGIDHMIYAGQSIDPNFGPFQLHSLRYEQLRAICDCARTALHLQTEWQTGMQVTHLVLVQDCTVDIFHNESTERLFDVRGTHDTRYEIVKKRIDKAIEAQTQTRITQPGMVTIVHSTAEEWTEYRQYLRYLQREGWVDSVIEQGAVEPLQGVTGLKFARVRVLPEA
jgi:hypothetical protein